MEAKFEEKIRRAKQGRSKRYQRTLAWCCSLAILMLLVVVLFMTTSITVEFEGPESELSLTVRSGIVVFLGERRFLLFSDAALLSVAARGYQPKVVPLDENLRGGAVTFSLMMSLRPVKLISDITPLRPSWNINGSFYTSSVVPVLNLKPGEYSLILRAANLEPYQSNFKVPFAGDSEFEVNLHPVSRKGEYVIETNPAGARIKLNDADIGVAPISGETVANDIKVSIELSGYETIEDAVTAEELTAGLFRKYELKSGRKTLKLTFRPEGGRLYQNGNEVPIRSTFSVDAVENSIFSYEKTGYERQQIEVSPSERSIEFSLTPIYGNLVALSHPSSDVFVNGELRGESPIDIRLQAGSYTVELRRQGYRSATRKIEITKDTRSKIDAELLTLDEYYDRSSPSSLVNSVGIDLLRIQPRPFVMGAPRSERGQRANEIQRKVTFDRPLYVSRYEITEEQYSQYSGGASTSKKPKTSIAWEDAVKFCNWLSAKEQLPPFYQLRDSSVVGYDLKSRGYRLPSEAEWEYVAKLHGKRTPTIFTWGNHYKIASEAGNIADSSADGVAKKFVADYNDGSAGVANVGTYPAEKSGFYDLSGNVSEWVHDAYILSSPRDSTYLNYLGEGVGSQHVVKGSNFLSVSWQELRASFREVLDEGDPHVGFRVARYIY